MAGEWGMPGHHAARGFRSVALGATVLAVALLAGCSTGRNVVYFDDTSAECAPEGVWVRPCFTRFTAHPELLNREEVDAFTRQRYPRRLLDRGIGGTVHVWVHLDRHGEVAHAGIARSSGDRDLDAFAVEVARRWRFAPARDEGEPVPVWVQYPVTLRATATSHRGSSQPGTRLSDYGQPM